MPLSHAFVLGLIQGLTEFLPVSSSGHLIFFPVLFGWQDQGVLFDAVVHLGTLVAVCIYFRNKLWLLVKGFFSRGPELATERRMAWLLLLSIIPAGLVGVLFGDWIEMNLRAAWVVGIDMIVWGVVLFFADRYARAREVRGTAVENNALTWRKVLGIGVAQAIALLPGTSRSGITMSAGFFAGLGRSSAAEFSFLMSVPIITLAGLSALLSVVKHGSDAVGPSALAVGFVTSAIAGFVAIWGIMKLLQTSRLTPFVVYRLLLGLILLLFVR